MRAHLFPLDLDLTSALGLRPDLTPARAGVARTGRKGERRPGEREEVVRAFRGARVWEQCARVPQQCKALVSRRARQTSGGKMMQHLDRQRVAPREVAALRVGRRKGMQDSSRQVAMWIFTSRVPALTRNAPGQGVTTGRQCQRRSQASSSLQGAVQTGAIARISPPTGVVGTCLSLSSLWCHLVQWRHLSSRRRLA